MGYNFYANYELLCIMRIETLEVTTIILTEVAYWREKKYQFELIS